MSDENINPDAPLHIRGLNHLTIPVKERYRAARFYIVAPGAEAIRTAITLKSIAPRSRKKGAASIRSAPTTRACACTNKTGRRKN